MKKSQRLLQFGTLALFSSMIGGLVLYRSGMFDTKPLPPKGFFEVYQDSLQPPPFDSIQFKQVLREILAEKSFADLRMYGTKSAPPAPPPPSPQKAKGKKKSTDLSLVNLDAATSKDSLEAMEVLQTRHAITQLPGKEATLFRQFYSDLREEKKWAGDYRFSHFGLAMYRDSSLALAKLFYGPQHLPTLSIEEMNRFQAVLDSLTRPRMMSSKSGIIFISSIDSTLALKIVKSEKRSK